MFTEGQVHPQQNNYSDFGGNARELRKAAVIKP